MSQNIIIILFLFIFSCKLSSCVDIGGTEYPPLRGSPGASNNQWWDDLEARLKRIDYDFNDLNLYYNGTNKLVTHISNKINLTCLDDNIVHFNGDNLLCDCSNFVLRKRLKVKQFIGNYRESRVDHEGSPSVNGSSYYDDNKMYECEGGAWKCPCTFVVDCSCYYGRAGSLYMVFGILMIIFGVMFVPTFAVLLCMSYCDPSKGCLKRAIYATIPINILLLIAGILVVVFKTSLVVSYCGNHSNFCVPNF